MEVRVTQQVRSEPLPSVPKTRYSMEFPWPLRRLASSFQPARAGPGAKHPSDSRTEPVGAGAGATQPGRCANEARLRCSPCRLGPRARAPSGRRCGSPVRAALADPDHWGPVKPRGGVEGAGLRPAGPDHWGPVKPSGEGGWAGPGPRASSLRMRTPTNWKGLRPPGGAGGGGSAEGRGRGREGGTRAGLPRGATGRPALCGQLQGRPRARPRRLYGQTPPRKSALAGNEHPQTTVPASQGDRRQPKLEGAVRFSVATQQRQRAGRMLALRQRRKPRPRHLIRHTARRQSACGETEARDRRSVAQGP